MARPQFQVLDTVEGMSVDELTIGELAPATGVATSALRYWEELGLLPAPARVSGQRRYPASAARLVAAILLYSDAGFPLAEQQPLLRSGPGEPGWRRLARRKLTELDEQITRAQAAREAISRELHLPHEKLTQCPRCHACLTSRLAGHKLPQSQPRLHGQG